MAQSVDPGCHPLRIVGRGDPARCAEPLDPGPAILGPARHAAGRRSVLLAPARVEGSHQFSRGRTVAPRTDSGNPPCGGLAFHPRASCRYHPPMKAAVHTRYGPPDVVRIEEVPRPIPGDKDVLVRVHATTVNRTDWGFRAGEPRIVRLFAGLTRPRITVLGMEFAGVVEEVGREATSFAVGDRVFGFSEDRWGAHADYLTIPEDRAVVAMPAGSTFEEIAPATEGSHYASSIIKGSGIRGGQDVMLNGSTGAIGSAALQLLRHLGANVTAVCPGQHVDLVRGLGADRVIDYTKEDFTQDGQVYDTVLDAVGKSSFGRCKRLLKPGGTYVSTDLGPGGMNPVLALVTPLFGGRKVRFPIPRKATQEELLRLKEVIESGAFKPLVDSVYPLDRIVEAYRYVETEQKVGGVVISVVPQTT
jgi:NADPH:quinone reductase-like Zn-dependent oxidoreductase